MLFLILGRLVRLALITFHFHGFHEFCHMDFYNHACSAATADNMNMVMAAPVPNPEAGTNEGLEYFGRLLDLSRSEGWGTLRQGLESRLLFDLPEHHSPAKSGDIGQPHGFTSARKRSYKRAILRVRRYGFTTYKGRTMDEGDLLGAYEDNRQQTSSSKRRSASSAPTHSESSLSLFSWNCGGLGTQQDELFTWLDTQPFQVVCLQETWYRSHMDFSTRGWQCINSGIGEHAQRAHAGVMILLRSSAFNMQSLRFNHVIPGHVLHVKVLGKGLGWIEIINVYQHAWGHQTTQSTIEAKRAAVWSKLRATLGQVPRGSTLVLCGDLNTTLQKRLPYTGTGMLRKSQPSPDADSLEELQSDFDCVAVNSFGRVDSYTYIHDGYAEARRSFVDFVFLRRRKHRQHKATLLRNFEVGRWRKGGRHLPVRVDFTLRPYHATPPATSTAAAWPAWKCKLLAQAVRDAPTLAEQFRHKVAASLEDVRTYQPSVLNQVLLDAGAQVFKIQRPSCLPAPAENPAHVGTIRQMWEHYRGMRQLSPGNFTNRTLLRNTVQAWRHWFQFHRLHKLVQKHSRHLRRQRLEALLSEAQAHERAGCTSAIFDLLRRHAPKQPRRRAQLRSTTGKLLTPKEETQVMLDYWKGVNGVNGDSQPPRQVHDTFQYNITRDEITQALRQLQARKSAPKHCAPHAFWNMAAPDIADFMEQHVFGAWRQGGAHVLPEWATAWLVFLGKVGKAGDSPAHLRPIALLEPMGKALAGILKQHLMPYVEPWTSQLHLHGYLPFRSPQQALGVVFCHCREVRNAVLAQGRSFYQLRAGAKRASCAGGLQLSVDFTQAFDCIDRGLLRRALEMMAVPAELTGLILQWVEATSFYIGSGADEVSYASAQGIRQGCKLSPTLWVCISVYVLRALDGVLSSNWSQQHAVGFADDLHFRWHFEDVGGLHAALQQAGAVLSKLQQLKLKISLDKTVCLLRADGAQAPHALRKITRKTKQGKLLRLDAAWEIPLKKFHIYLGACISYENFEKQNMLHRLQACRAAFCRLRPTLMAHRALNLHKRLALWKVTVVTSALYSLLASGFTAKTFDLLRVVLTRQARAIARSPRHLDLENDACFWNKIGIDPPVTMVRLRLEKAIEVTDSLSSLLPAHDARIAPALRTHESMVLEELQAIASPTQVKGATDDREHICIECGTRFGTGEALRAHTAKLHSEQRMQTAQDSLIEFDRHKHGKDGMPTCAGCNHRFSRWADLEKHIVENHCQAVPAQADSTASVATRTVMQLVQDGDFDVIDLQAGALTAPLREELRQHCALCRQWHPNAKYFKRHWQRVHTEEWEKYSASTFQWRREALPRIHGRCEWCHEQAPAKTDHRDSCYVLFQLSMLRTMHLSRHDSEPAEEAIPFPDASDIKRWNGQCQLCGVQCTNRLLQKHFATVHADVWGPAQPRVKQLCSSWAPKLGSKCQFCQGGYGKKLKHASSCPEILQNALALTLQQAPSSESLKPSASGPSTGQDGGDAGCSSNAGGVRTGPGKTAAGAGPRHATYGSASQGNQTRRGQGKRQRQGQKEGADPPPLQLSQWFQRGTGLVCGGHSTHESHDDPTGRCTGYPTSVHGVGLVAARTGTDHRTGPVPGSSGLEEGSDRPQESHGGDLASVGAPVVHPSSIESCPPVRRHGAARAGDAERLVHQGQGLGVPSLVPGSAAAGDRRSQEAAVNLSGASALVGHEKPDQRGHRLDRGSMRLDHWPSI